MANIDDLKETYLQLDQDLNLESEEAIRQDQLLTFEYEYKGSNAEVVIDTDEFTAGCPWTGLPDFGQVVITYVPHERCLELKSLKYYLMSYRNVSIVQEHAANRILNDLVEICQPIEMTVCLDYKVRGGLHTVVKVSSKH